MKNISFIVIVISCIDLVESKLTLYPKKKVSPWSVWSSNLAHTINQLLHNIMPDAFQDWHRVAQDHTAALKKSKWFGENMIAGRSRRFPMEVRWKSPSNAKTRNDSCQRTLASDMKNSLLLGTLQQKNIRYYERRIRNLIRAASRVLHCLESYCAPQPPGLLVA